MTDAEFAAAFETGEISGDFEFHHADHVRMAWLYLCRYSLPEAITHFAAALRRFASAKDKPDLYHETITLAYLLLINERMHRDGTPKTWEQFATDNPALLNSPKIFLSQYYSEQLLSSSHARRVFVFPDRIGATQS